MSSIMDVGRRLDRLAISRFHWRVLGLIAAGMFFDSFDLVQQWLGRDLTGGLAATVQGTARS